MVSCSIISSGAGEGMYAANHARRPPSASSRVVVGLLGRCFIEKRANWFTGAGERSSCGLTRVCVTRAITGLFMHGERVRYAVLSGTCSQLHLVITHGVIKWNRRNFVTGEFRARRIKPTCGPLPWVSTRSHPVQPYQRYAARFPSLQHIDRETIALLVLNERIAANRDDSQCLTMMVLLCDDLRQCTYSGDKQAIGAVVIPAPICPTPACLGRYPY